MSITDGNSVCRRCGAALVCAQAAGGGGDEPCWCSALPAVLPVPAMTGQDAGASCWCRACLELAIAGKTAAPPPPTP